MARYTETVYPVKKLVPLSAEMAEAISEYRHQQRISSENEAIRRLIELGLGKAPASTPSGGSTPGATKKPAAGKRAPAPKAKALLSKEAQIRALREQGTG